MKDECLKGRLAEKLITPLLSGPNICYPFPQNICDMHGQSVCICVRQKKRRGPESDCVKPAG